MIALDTNVLVRYLTHDDDEQFAQAEALLLGLERTQRSAHLSVVTLCETVWVLSRAYRTPREQMVVMLDGLLATSLFVIEDKDAVREAVEHYRSGSGDFADYLLGVRARLAGCTIVATFDVALHDHPEFFAAPSAVLKKTASGAKGASARRLQDKSAGRRYRV